MNNLGFGPGNILAGHRANQMRLMQMGRAPTPIAASAPRPGPDMGSQMGRGLDSIGGMLKGFAGQREAEAEKAKQAQRDQALARAVQAGNTGVKEWTNPDTGEVVIRGQKPGPRAMMAELSRDPATAAEAAKMQALMIPHELHGEREQAKREHETQLAQADIAQRVALAEKIAPGNKNLAHYATLSDSTMFESLATELDRRGRMKRTTLTNDEEIALGLDPSGVYQWGPDGGIQTIQGRPPSGPRARFVTMHHPKRPGQPVTVEEGSKRFNDLINANYVIGQPRSQSPGALVNLKGPGGDMKTVYSNSDEAARLIGQGYTRENRGDVLDEIMAAAFRGQAAQDPTVPASSPATPPGTSTIPTLKTLDELDGKLADGTMNVGDTFQGPSGNTWRVVDRQGNVEKVEGGSPSDGATR